jgi:hypothetical protein
MNTAAVPPARPPMTLDEIADATAALIREARAAGLPETCSITAHDWGTPEVSLYLSATGNPGIWAALRAWASHYGTEVATRATTSQRDNIHAYAEFRRDGLRVQVTSVISSEDHPGDQDQGEGEGQ